MVLMRMMISRKEIKIIKLKKPPLKEKVRIKKINRLIRRCLRG